MFRPRSDASLLARVMAERRMARDARVLDVFTGSGVLAISAARAGAREVTAVDISRRAIATVWLNSRLNGVRVRARRGDLFSPVDDERFDLIVANPPYLPGAETLPRHGSARAWEGGHDGRVLVDRLCAEVRDHMYPGGRVVLVHSSLTGERPTLDALADQGLHPEVLARRTGPLGPLGRSRAAALQTREPALSAEEADQEELLVMSGTAR